MKWRRNIQKRNTLIHTNNRQYTTWFIKRIRTLIQLCLLEARAWLLVLPQALDGLVFFCTCVWSIGCHLCVMTSEELDQPLGLVLLVYSCWFACCLRSALVHRAAVDCCLASWSAFFSGLYLCALVALTSAFLNCSLHYCCCCCCRLVDPSHAAWLTMNPQLMSCPVCYFQRAAPNLFPFRNCYLQWQALLKWRLHC